MSTKAIEALKVAYEALMLSRPGSEINEATEEEWAAHFAARRAARDALASLEAEAAMGGSVAWPAKHVSLKQRKDKKLLLTVELDAVQGWPNYWITRSDARGKCSTPVGCSAHGCHGECLNYTHPHPSTEEAMEMALCEAHSVVLREGQLYRFRKLGDCERCARMSAASLEAYGPPAAMQAQKGGSNAPL
jgi:hypothetical protein